MQIYKLLPTNGHKTIWEKANNSRRDRFFPFFGKCPEKEKQDDQYEPITVVFSLNLLIDDKILDWSKLKQIADNILKCI